MPRVLRPGNLSTFTRLTLDPSLFAAVFPGILSPEKKKLLAVTVVGSLQNFPFTNTTQRKVCYYHIYDSSVPMDNSMPCRKKKSNAAEIMVRHNFFNL